MDTSAISYRVADFLKQHPPFHAVADADLIALAASGRVRFHEANEFLLWQGEPHKLHVFVIQQGTVSLWDESGGRAELRDVRGPGDLLGAERFNGARACLYSARAGSDVVVYGFAAEAFEAHILKYPYARQYVEALGAVSADFQPTDGRPDPHGLFVHDVAGPLQTCGPDESIADVARVLTRTSAQAVGVVDAEARPLGVVTATTLVEWLSNAGAAPDSPVSGLLGSAQPVTVGADARVTDAVLALGGSAPDAIAMTMDGTPQSRLLGVVTPRDLMPAFGDQPADILQRIRRAGHFDELRALNQRARACALQHLTTSRAVEWMAPFITLVDEAILARVLAMGGLDATGVCWCVCGASGRRELMTLRQPHVVLIHDEAASADPLEAYVRAGDALAACGYSPGLETSFDASFSCASVDEWRQRYEEWIDNPVVAQMARARAFFDLRPVHGSRDVWTSVSASVNGRVSRDILQVLAHDCLASLPPLTFFQNAVVDDTGEESAVFRLEQTALRPLVDVGRVFGMAARQTMGTSTLERFALARTLVPERQTVFRDAAAAFTIVLWQQARIGISQGTSGAELPPSLLSRADRHVLKSAFPAIQRLLALTAESAWLDAR